MDDNIVRLLRFKQKYYRYILKQQFEDYMLVFILKIYCQKNFIDECNNFLINNRNIDSVFYIFVKLVW